MTLELKKIWNSVNKVLTIINTFLLALILSGGSVAVKDKPKKIPVVFNIILLIV
jgi:hypothetical protein